jgi:hypothetical protein
MNTLESSSTMQKNEGKTTSIIEAQTSRVPSMTYLTLAVGSMVASAALMASGRKQLANFIGQWAPSLLVIGLYNKIVKLEDELLAQRDRDRDRGAPAAAT